MAIITKDEFINTVGLGGMTPSHGKLNGAITNSDYTFDTGTQQAGGSVLDFYTSLGLNTNFTNPNDGISGNYMNVNNEVSSNQLRVIDCLDTSVNSITYTVPVATEKIWAVVIRAGVVQFVENYTFAADDILIVCFATDNEKLALYAINNTFGNNPIVNEAINYEFFHRFEASFITTTTVNDISGNAVNGTLSISPIVADFKKIKSLR
jgi:hypothetical protein